ncbi:MAG: sialate O-acetylesterase, partial [Muribaculaceae bacterium]|nr:sialate O-acetylesterase [Muribaculaceae bacterium]
MIVGAAVLASAMAAQAQDPNFHIYLCYGQSNMEGNALVENIDRKDIPDRFKMMPAVSYANPKREKGEWYEAIPPL